MAIHRTIARPYAKAIFDQAVIDDRLEEWSLVLQGLALITAVPKVVELYGNPKITSNMIKSANLWRIKRRCTRCGS